MSAATLRPASAVDVPRLTELVGAAYGHYVERLGGPPRPMTDDYAGPGAGPQLAGQGVLSDLIAVGRALARR